ncbi:AraC family transcriptional regulator [Variovorax saccharolyticus]|uniref:AraC family transcriptional regulator n=1 Tax=Variovorax saccharolyticus TaxID=3053516 RepID=UPI002576DD1E|nr:MULTISPECIES: AraC family transcriptional regulator [unclassified Variovorax]MDM0022251.1 AraC family transcriptional regulator [Variovorax sp. J22R187]MDM0028808.1 AraC family transcriptional regulator [Variovorax sp. J31P216]
MKFKTHSLRFGNGREAAAAWSEVMYLGHGLNCKFDDIRSRGSNVRGWLLGDIGITRGELAALQLSPADESSPAWQGEWLYFKLITSGEVIVEHGHQTERFGVGQMLAVDPSAGFTETVPEGACLTVLRIPKATLRDRGWRQTGAGLLIADPRSPDYKAIGALIHCIADQADAPGQVMRRLMAQQLLDVVEVALASGGGSRRSSQAILFRAKEYVRTHLASSDLDIHSVSSAVNVSAKHLERLFRQQGESLMRHVWETRLDRAESLLRSAGPGGPSVQEIASRSGFATAAHFSRSIKQRYGMSPKDLKNLGNPSAEETADG